jgi:hypothetical protein
LRTHMRRSFQPMQMVSSVECSLHGIASALILGAIGSILGALH